jgi:hypothetical protein
MKRLCLATALIIITIGSIIAMEMDNKPVGNLIQQQAELNQLNEQELIAQKNALEAFRDDLKVAIDQGVEQLKKYEKNEDTLYEADLLLFKLDPTKYTTPTMPEDLSSSLSSYIEMMQNTYISFTNQFADRENLNPVVPRRYYEPKDLARTLQEAVNPFINAEIKKIRAEIEAAE